MIVVSVIVLAVGFGKVCGWRFHHVGIGPENILGQCTVGVCGQQYSCLVLGKVICWR